MKNNKNNKEQRKTRIGRSTAAVCWVSIAVLVLVQTTIRNSGFGRRTRFVGEEERLATLPSSLSPAVLPFLRESLFGNESEHRPRGPTNQTAFPHEPSQRMKKNHPKGIPLAPDEAALVQLLNSKERRQRKNASIEDDIIPLLLNSSGHHLRQTPSTTPQYVQNLHIAFIGDSVVRYLYNTFAVFLHTGSWPDPPPSAATTVAFNGGHEHWNALFGFVKEHLAPYEQCDCYRKPHYGQPSETYENHYYFDPTRNLSLTFIGR